MSGLGKRRIKLQEGGQRWQRWDTRLRSRHNRRKIAARSAERRVLYQVNKLLRDINRSAELAQRCRTESEAVLQHYDLTAEEREAIEGWQVRKLYDMGANPLLLLVYSMATGKDMRAYVAAINEKS